MLQVGNSNAKYVEMAVVKIDRDGNRFLAGVYRWHRNPIMRLWFRLDDWIGNATQRIFKERQSCSK